MPYECVYVGRPVLSWAQSFYVSAKQAGVLHPTPNNRRQQL